MTEEHVFLAALDLPDVVARAAYLNKACGGNAHLRQQVDALLAAHFRSGEFLNVPAAEQIGVDPSAADTLTVGGDSVAPEESDGLQFLTPSTRPDSLGRLGHYEMLQVLGRGGFGIVFRAFDDTLQRVVAVKMMAPQIAVLSPARKRFLREARTSAAVRHEHVVDIHEVGEHPLPYLVMEFVAGETLQHKLDRSGPLEVSEVLRIGRQIAEGLAAAHASDLIHRDIKPGNILLEGGAQKVKITDFGLARTADDASISQSGIIAGTPMFMAPEQALGHKLDQRADLFSLGSVLYQMAAGRPPFRANGTVAVLKRVAEDTPREIREIIPETPQWLCAIIARLHEKNPEDRFQSAREVADLLADCEAKLKAKQSVTNVLPAAVKPAAPVAPAGRKRVAAAVALLLPVIALAVTEFAGVTHLFRGQQAPPDPTKPGSEPPPVVVEKKEPPVPVPVAKKGPPLAVAPFTDADVRRIAALPAAEQVEEVRKELMRLNPGLDGTARHKIEGGVVTELIFTPVKGQDVVTDLSPVRALGGLTYLNLWGCGGLEDLEPLKSLKLTRLIIGSFYVSTEVRDLEPLRGMKLTELSLYNCQVQDLEPLKDMPLTRLVLLSRQVRSCEPLKRMPLNVLNLTSCTQIQDFTPLQGLPLTELYLNDCKVRDLEPFKGMKLTGLGLSGTQIRDLELLKGMPLKNVRIQKTGVTDLRPLQGMELKEIYLTPKNITQGLEILRGMESLETIGVDQYNPAWKPKEFWERYDKGEFKK